MTPPRSVPPSTGGSATGLLIVLGILVFLGLQFRSSRQPIWKGRWELHIRPILRWLAADAQAAYQLLIAAPIIRIRQYFVLRRSQRLLDTELRRIQKDGK